MDAKADDQTEAKPQAEKKTPSWLDMISPFKKKEKSAVKRGTSNIYSEENSLKMEISTQTFKISSADHEKE